MCQSMISIQSPTAEIRRGKKEEERRKKKKETEWKYNVLPYRATIIKSHILKFADDTKIFKSITNNSDYNDLQEDINNLIRWSQDWQMLFSVDKCKVMHFGRTNESLSYYMNDAKLDKVTEENDLVVWISNDLKASQQCVQACSRILGVLNRTIKCKDDSNLICFYKSLIRPHLEFCTAAWSLHYAKDKLLIEKVQRRFTRMIPRLKMLRMTKGLKNWNSGHWKLTCRLERSIQDYSWTVVVNTGYFLCIRHG